MTVFQALAKPKQKTEERFNENDNEGMRKRIRERNLPKEESILISLGNCKIKYQESKDDFRKNNNNFEEKKWDVFHNFDKLLKNGPCFQVWFPKIKNRVQGYLERRNALEPYRIKMKFSSTGIGSIYVDVMNILLAEPLFWNNFNDIEFDIFYGLDYDYWKTKDQKFW